jgi:hypothetical protein
MEAGCDAPVCEPASITSTVQPRCAVDPPEVRDLE